MKKTVFTVLTVMFLFGGALYLGMNAYAGDQEDYSTHLVSLEVDETGNYSLEDMLVYAMLDEIHAKQTYEAMIDVYGDARPFNRIVVAEQKHMDLLLPLFETYQIDVPSGDIDVLVPETMEEALEAGVEAEIANIALYEAFLSQELPDDVRAVFESLVAASNNHLEAFSKDRGGMFKGLGNQLFQKGKGTGVCLNDSIE